MQAWFMEWTSETPRACRHASTREEAASERGGGGMQAWFMEWTSETPRACSHASTREGAASERGGVCKHDLLYAPLCKC